LAEGLKEITKILYSQLLPSGGANCHFPLVYCHAPLTFFGLTLPQVIDMQLIKHVKRVMVHGALQTHSGKYLNISLEQAQLEVRIGTPIFEASYKDYGLLLMFCWVKMLWQFLWMHNIILCNPDQVLPKLQQEGDFFIMEYIVLS
jgi:hypothetical protein